MREIVDNINVAAETRPLITGLVGVVAGWGGAIAYWLDLANKFFLTFGALFGSIGAFFTMLILIRNWIRGKKPLNDKD